MVRLRPAVSHPHAWSALVALVLSTCVPLSLLYNAALAAGSGASVTIGDTTPQYIVLIDAGSTGSRAHVHQWSPSTDPQRSLPIVQESVNKKINPGLSSYAADPPAARESVLDLLEFIKKTVPQNAWANTPIHLHATAGLRSVSPYEANAILEVVRDSLSESGFKFRREWAKVISGEQEGINGWMAVNYLMGVFDNAQTSSVAKESAPSQTMGVVEMGGSSMQITFAPASSSPADRSRLTTLEIAGKTYHLYTHSFLQYGLQAAEKLYQRLAIDSIEESGNPCYPRALRHSATGDFDQCTSLLERVVDRSVKCAAGEGKCSFNGVFQPKINEEQFVAIENFYYTVQFFGTAEQEQEQQGTENGGNNFIKGLRAKGKEFCNMDWSALKTEYTDTPEEKLRSFCFSAAYQTMVLESGLGFSDAANLRVAKTINGKSIDWELGAALFEIMNKDQPPTAAAITPTSKGGHTTTAVQEQASSSFYCHSCVVYTILVAVALVAAYLGWQRYAKRGSGNLTSYSQVVYNRV